MLVLDDAGSFFRIALDLLNSLRPVGQPSCVNHGCQVGKPDSDVVTKINKAHGRIETRECWVTSDPEYINYIDPGGSWQNLRSLATVKATRVKEGETSSQIRYFISSVEFGAARIMDFIRRHWEVENKPHWSLDISFREDDSRVRTGHAPENLAPIRKMALNLLRLNKSKKCGAKTKRMLCAVDTKFLSEILNS